MDLAMGDFFIVYREVSGYLNKDDGVWPYPKQVIHERPPAGANFDKLNAAARPALAEPLHGKPDTYKLPKDLRYLGRSDKVALHSELVFSLLEIAACIVASEVRCETHAHIPCKGHGLCCLDCRCKLLRQGRGPFSGSRVIKGPTGGGG